MALAAVAGLGPLLFLEWVSDDDSKVGLCKSIRDTVAESLRRHGSYCLGCVENNFDLVFVRRTPEDPMEHHVVPSLAACRLVHR